MINGLYLNLPVAFFLGSIKRPLTTDREQKWVQSSPTLYPKLPSKAGGLPKDSVVLLDQIQIIDASRVVLKLGELKKNEMEPIAKGLKKILNFHL